MSSGALGDRIAKARKHRGISVDALARSIGRTAFTVYRYQWGTLKPSKKIVEAIALECGVNLPWLDLGEGPMAPRKARSA
jgi:ribosome-binding protein aMBF1 (putative translation factor)